MTKNQKSQKNYVRKIRCTFACSYIIDMIDSFLFILTELYFDSQPLTKSLQ